MKFLSFFIKRLLYSILVLVGLSVLIFIIARILPGDPARLALGPFASQEMVARLRHQMGMDQPLHLQYVAYVRGIFHGDLGLSFQTRRGVSLDIAHYLPATFELVLVAIIWVLIIGVPFGILAGRYKDSWLDNISRVVAFVGVAVPPFVVGLIGQLIFSYGLGILPTTGRLSLLTPMPPARTGLLILDSLIAGNFSAFGDALIHILLPSLAIAMTGIGQITRLTRGSVSDVLGKDYIEAARAFGIPNRYVTFKYMLKPSFIPPLTILGLTFASELGNAFLVEQVFSWPGMAKYGIQAILRKDFNAIMGVILIIGLAFVAVNFIVDVLAGYVDPRIRIQEES
ncbi:ABC transporter permease [Candidatus Bipolaricaulota bacterium]|nr:ABC transporter permease [Candidatus Bipolaricaulota bacterium]